MTDGPNDRNRTHSTAHGEREAALASLTAQYLRTAGAEWASLEVGGAKVPLTDVFVLLEALERPKPRPLESPSDLPGLPERWEHAGLPRALEEKRVPEERKTLPVPLSRALRDARHLVLLGEPGAGKTTTLQYIALWFAARAGAVDATLHADLAVDEPCVPVRLDLRALTGKLEDALAEEVESILRKGREVARELVLWWRDSGRLLPLVDGLDEVPGARREDVRKEIARFARSPDGSKCRIVVASRIAGYTPLDDFQAYTLKPFGKPEEARGYLANWLAVLRPEWRGEEAQRRADRLLEEMGRTALRRLTDNLLLLRLAAELYARKEEAARSRAELYRRWVEEEAWGRARQRGASEEKREIALKRLEEVAWALQNRLPLPELSPDDERLLREQMGLLARLGEKQLVFAHLTFQEYFVARRLARAWRENRPGAWAFLHPRLHLPEWREPLLLLAGELAAEEAADLVQRVAGAHSRYESYLGRDFLLALSLVGEARALPQEVRGTLVAGARWLLRKDVPYALKIALVDALQVLPADDVVPALLKALRDKDEDVRWAAAWALGTIGDPQAVPALLKALRDESMWVRWAAAWALGTIGDPQAVPALLETLRDESMWVRWAAARALGTIGDPQVVPALLKALEDKDEDVRRAAAEALGAIGDPQVVPALLKALEDKDEDVRRAAAEALGKIGDPQTVPALLKALKDKDEDVRRAAAEALGKIGDPQTVPALLKALRDESMWVRWAAAEALGKLGDPQTVPALLQALKDENRVVREAAARALGAIGDLQAVPALLQALKDENWVVREAAAEALGAIGDLQAVPALLQALKDENRVVRRATARALGKIGDLQAVPALLKALKDKDEDVRRAAAEALGKLGDPQVVPALLKALKDKDEDVRRAAARALGKIGDPQAVPALLKALKDKDEDVRRAAAEALGKLGDPQVVPALLKALKDKDEDVRRAAARALGKIVGALQPKEEERQEQAALLDRVAQALYRARRKTDVYEPLRTILEKLDALTVSYFDPFAPPPTSLPVRVARQVGVYLVIAILLAALALLVILSGAVEEVLGEQAKAWLKRYPVGVLLLLAAGLAALGGGLSWAVERIRKRAGAGQ